MKKIIFAILMLAATVPVWSQTNDTLELGMREPTFYYWDTNWFDHYALHITNNNPNVEWSRIHYSMSECQAEYARYCYTDTALRIIGIAGAFHFTTGTAPWYNDNPYDYLVADYFRLYEIDSTTEEMIMLAEEEWTKTQPRYIMDNGYQPNLDPYFGNRNLDTVYEVYFKEPQIVHDSFYVSATHFNNLDGDFYHSYVLIFLSATKMYVNSPDSNVNYYGPVPNHIKRKLHVVNEYNVDHAYFETDTLWHTYHKTHNSPYIASEPDDLRLFLCLFPIIDTGWHVPLPDECPAPTGLSLLYVNNEVAVLTWNGTPAHAWQLAIARDGDSPENGTVYSCNTDLRAVTGLDTATWYTAWVRSVCDNDSVSDWSDSVRFLVPSQPDGPIAIGNANDAFVNIMPNPASGELTVFSSYRMNRIDVYSMTGRRVITFEPSSNTANVDITSLPAGNYLVRIYSTNGVINKRLVVR